MDKDLLIFVKAECSALRTLVKKGLGDLAIDLGPGNWPSVKKFFGVNWVGGFFIFNDKETKVKKRRRMKIIKKLSEDEVKQFSPNELLKALFAQPKEVIYCMTCDGLRFKDHECISVIISERANKKGEEYANQGDR